MIAGDADAVSGAEPALVSFADLYASQYEAMLRLAGALVGRWDVAEELVQDAFVALHRRWDRVSRYDSPVDWLRRVVSNRAISTLRRRATEVRLLGQLARERNPAVEPPSAQHPVWQVVVKLPKRQAQVIALRYVDDLSVAQIASVLQCNENTVRTHLRRARLTIADRLDLEDEQ